MGAVMSADFFMNFRRLLRSVIFTLGLLIALDAKTDEIRCLSSRRVATPRCRGISSLAVRNFQASDGAKREPVPKPRSSLTTPLASFKRKS
jgi:hypothetical protein